MPKLIIKALLLCCSLLAGQVLAQTRAAVEVLVDVPVAAAWNYLQDFTLAHNYVPGLSRTEVVSAARSGLGAHRRVYDMDGDYIEETITEWREGEGFVIRLHEGDEPMAPFDEIFFTYAISPEGEDRTRVALAMDFVMPLGSVGETLGEWFILPVMEDNLVQVAAGMKHFYESGEPATDDDREREAGAVVVTSPGGGD